MLPQEDIQLIEAWLDGALDVEGKKQVEARMRNDPEFAAELALHRQMRQAVREKDIGAFRQTVDGLLKTYQSDTADPPPEKKIQLARYFWALAAALLLALAAIWFFNRETPPSTAELYAEAFKPLDPVGFRAGRSDNNIARQEPEAWVELDSLLAADDKTAALAKALDIARSDTALINRQNAWYAAGVLALDNQNPEAAITYLKNAEGRKLYAEEVAWYTALAHVQIALRNPQYSDQAIQALEKARQGSQPEPRYLLLEKLIASLRSGRT